MDIIIQSMHRNLISNTIFHTKLKTHSFPFFKTTCNWTNISLWDENRPNQIDACILVPRYIISRLKLFLPRSFAEINIADAA